jgi:SAM-dependent methyltransferase
VKSTAELAADQAAFWNGKGGQMWLAAYDRIQRGLEAYSEATLSAAAARPGEKVLDIGCGTGTTTGRLAAAVGASGHVLGVDISEPLIDAARRQKLANATFAVSDAATYPFEPAMFDLAFSRFGVMFFADPIVAFKNVHRALKPSGRLVFVCWRTPQENPWGAVPMRAAAPHLPPMERPGPEDPGQYAFGDRARVERILKAAGFGTPTFAKLDHMNFMGRDVADVLENLGKFGPLARLFAEASPEQVAKAKQAIAEALAPHAGADGVRLPGACWLVSAAQH